MKVERIEKISKLHNNKKDSPQFRPTEQKTNTNFEKFLQEAMNKQK